MSTELAIIKSLREDQELSEGLYITSYYGGFTHGQCIQLTEQQGGYIQLDKEGVKKLVNILNGWLER